MWAQAPSQKTEFDSIHKDASRQERLTIWIAFYSNFFANSVICCHFNHRLKNVVLKYIFRMGKTQSSPHAPVIRTSDPIIPSESRLSKEIHTDGVPIEELALASIFPDLNIANRMQIDKLDCQHEHSHLHQDYIKDPLPVVAVKLTKTVPTPSYQLLKNTNQKKRPLSKAEDFPPFSKFIEATENELAERVEYDMDEQGITKHVDT